MAIYQTPAIQAGGQVLQEYLILQARTLRIFGHGWDLPAVLAQLSRAQEGICP